MAEFQKLPTREELQQMLYMQQIRPQSTQDILQQNLASQTIKPIPENVFQKIAGGAKIAGDYVNRAGTAADVAKLFPGYTGQSQVSIPTSFNFAPKQAPTGEILPQGMQTQQVNVGQLLQAIKPADVLGISGAQRAYSDIGMGKAPQPLDVVDVAGLGALGLAGTKAAVKGIQATKGLPVGMSIQDVSKAGGLLQEAPRSPLGFYSALEETALNLQRNKGAGQAFLNDLQKGANVKAEEIKWIGLDDFLKNKPNVTKQEVQDYIANNRVDVQEVKSTIPRLPGEGMAGDEGAFLPKFGQYTLPGGENYREILLTMPDKGTTKQAEEFARQMYEKYGTPTFRNMMTQDELAKFDDLNNTVQQYSSAHFPQKNILAHLRVNDRVDADGKKMLLIEEVQSDWHQAGREKGYAGAESKAAESAFRQYSKELADKYDLNPEQNLSMYATLKRMQPEEVAKYEQLQSAWTASKGGVPDAPFKDSWYQLALKRAIQHAAENGYDRIGLTTGSQQAARFDLSKQVDELNYKKNADGTYKLSAQTGGMGNMIGEAIPESKLADYVGKEVAQKIIDNAGKEVNFGGSGSVSQPKDIWKGLSGIDLKIGGEGMKKYYDEIYPKFLEKYGKKWGARVGETKVKTSVEGDDMFEVVLPNGKVIKTTANKKSADATAADFEGAIVRDINFNEPIRYLDITPEMKASVSKGQPMFQVGIGATGGLLGAQEERK